MFRFIEVEYYIKDEYAWRKMLLNTATVSSIEQGPDKNCILARRREGLPPIYLRLTWGEASKIFLHNSCLSG